MAGWLARTPRATTWVAMTRISTPCTKVCILDPETGLCEGCGRTADEIGGWGMLSEAERLAIMAGLDERMRRLLAPVAPPDRMRGLPG